MTAAANDRFTNAHVESHPTSVAAKVTNRFTENCQMHSISTLLGNGKLLNISLDIAMPQYRAFNSSAMPTCKAIFSQHLSISQIITTS